MTQGAAGEQSPAGAAGEIPVTRSSLRCAAPRLCCLPGCPSRPHRPHPLPHPLPLRLGPRHRRCRCLRHSRRRFPSSTPSDAVASAAPATTAGRLSSPSPTSHTPPTPSARPRTPPPRPHAPTRTSRPALPASQTLGRAPLGETRRRRREHCCQRSRRATRQRLAAGRASPVRAGGGGGTLRVAGELLAGRRRVSTQIMGRLSGVRPGARVARGEGGALGALAAVKPPRVGAGWPRASGGCGAALRPPERAVVARVAFVRDCLGAPAASPPA